jgi:hypothetical protein
MRDRFSSRRADFLSADEKLGYHALGVWLDILTTRPALLIGRPHWAHLRALT